MKTSLLHPSNDTFPKLLELVKSLYDHEALLFDGPKVESGLRHLLNTPDDGDVWLIQCESDGVADIVGYIVLTYSYSVHWGGHAAIIDQLYISPSWRNQGIGSWVIPELENLARERGCCAVSLEVNIGNGGARTFYERHDFIPRRQFCVMVKPIN